MVKESSILSSFIEQKKEEYNRFNHPKIKRRLNLDVRHRWNSTYKMLTSLNIHRLLIIQLFQKKMNLKITKKQQQRLTALEFTSDCWHTIELLINVLKPFYAATKVMSGSEYPTIGLTFFIFRRLEKDFLSVENPDDDYLFRNMKSRLLDKMNFYNNTEDPSQVKIIMVSTLVF